MRESIILMGRPWACANGKATFANHRKRINNALTTFQHATLRQATLRQAALPQATLRQAAFALKYSVKARSAYAVTCESQCDQIGRFIGLWATF